MKKTTLEDQEQLRTRVLQTIGMLGPAFTLFKVELERQIRDGVVHQIDMADPDLPTSDLIKLYTQLAEDVQSLGSPVCLLRQHAIQRVEALQAKLTQIQHTALSHCYYCGGPLVEHPTGTKAYPYPHIKCKPCKAWVGLYATGPAAGEPLGTVANATDRALRIQAHKELDKLWANRTERSQAYALLAQRLGVSEQHCHIAWLNGAKLQECVEICTAAKTLFDLALPTKPISS